MRKNILKREEVTSFPKYLYLIVLFAFIPVWGVFFTAIGIYLGIKYERSGGKKLIIFSSLGLWFTILPLSYFAYKEGLKPIIESQVRYLETSTINNAFYLIEQYQNLHSSYPNSLNDIDELVHGSLYYQKIDSNHYYLLGKGVDKIAFTSDDILPTATFEKEAEHGLQIKTLRMFSRSEKMLTDIVGMVEFYYAKKHSYPESLNELNKLLRINLTYTDPHCPDSLIYYSNNGTNYYLFSRGPDRTPFTKDDEYPKNEMQATSIIGYKRPEIRH